MDGGGARGGGGEGAPPGLGFTFAASEKGAFGNPKQYVVLKIMPCGQDTTSRRGPVEREKLPATALWELLGMI